MKSKDIDVVDFARFVGLSLIAKGMRVSMIKLQSVVFYCQAWYMVYFDNTLLFRDCPVAWLNVPAYERLFWEFGDKCEYSTDTMLATDFCVGVKTRAGLQRALRRLADALRLTDADVHFLDSVIRSYGRKDEGALIMLAHCEDPWVRARGDDEPFVDSLNEISLSEVYRYYSERLSRKQERRRYAVAGV